MASVIREYTLKLTTKEAQKNLKEVTDSLQLQDDAINRINKDLIKYEKSLADTVGFSGKAMQKRSALNKLIEKTKLELKEETLGRKQLFKEQQRAAKQLQQAKKDTAEFGGVMKVLDASTGGAVSSMTNLVSGVGGATKGFKGMRLAIIATGIGALLIAVTSLAAAFTRSEEGQNKFSKLMGVMGAITGQFLDLLAGLGDKLIWVFTSPREALTSFVELIKSQIINRFNAAIDTVGFLGKAIKKVFEGDFSGAMDAAKEAGNSYVDVLTGVENSLEKVTTGVKDFVKETVKEAETAAKIADMRANIDKTARELVVERAEADAKIAKLREIAADKFNVSVEERIQALKDAAALEDGIAAKELKLAKQRLEAHQLQMSLGLDDKAALDEEAKLIAAVSKVEEDRATKQRMLIRSTTMAQREANAEIAADKKIADDKQDEIDALKIQKDKDLAALKKEIRDAEANTEDEERALELLKIQEHYDALILLADENDIVTDELKATRDEILAEKQAEFDAIDQERKQKLLDDDKKIEDKKRKMAMKTLDNAARMVGEHTKLGKAMLLAKQVMLIKQMIMDAKSQISTGTKVVAEAGMQGSEAGVEVAGSIAKGANTAPPPANIPFILSAIATGVGIISSVKSAIKATKSAAASVGASGGAAPTPVMPNISPTAPILPDITSVGQDNVSQLAGAIGGQSQPVQAFVVSGDVTTSQSLERNIIDSASIG